MGIIKPKPYLIYKSAKKCYTQKNIKIYIIHIIVKLIDLSLLLEFKT